MHRDSHLMPWHLTIWASDDLVAYSNLLRESFPQVLFYESFRYIPPEEMCNGPPPLIVRETLAGIEGGMGEIIIAHRGWRPDMVLKQGPYSLIWTWAEQPQITGCYRGGAPRVWMPVVAGAADPALCR